MFQHRKEYRKSFTSPGQLHVAGETLAIVSYDVSVNGILVEMIAGNLLSSTRDIQEVIKESLVAEVFITDLMLSGMAQIVWTKSSKGKLMVGLEFVDVHFNAKKLWRKRTNYRKPKNLSGLLINEAWRAKITTVNVSADGLMISLKEQPVDFPDQGMFVKVVLTTLNMKAIAKIQWVKKDSTNSIVNMGLRYLLMN